MAQTFPRFSPEKTWRQLEDCLEVSYFLIEKCFVENIPHHNLLAQWNAECYQHPNLSFGELDYTLALLMLAESGNLPPELYATDEGI